MNKFKFLILMFITFIPGLSLAGWPVTWTPNWLVGISGGYAEREGQVAVDVSFSGFMPMVNGVPVMIPPASDNPGLMDTGFIWGILVGYQAICHKWLVGIELNADRHSISKEHHFTVEDPIRFLSWEGSARYQRKMMAGLTTRIGYAIRPNFMPYIRGGVEIGEDRFKTFYFNEDVLRGSPAFNEQSRWVWRFLLGAGVEYPLYPQCGITLRAEWDYHSKGKTLETTAALFDNGLAVLFLSKAQPRTSTIRLTLVWNIF